MAETDSVDTSHGVGLVVVSHSRALARAAVALARLGCRRGCPGAHQLTEVEGIGDGVTARVVVEIDEGVPPTGLSTGADSRRLARGLASIAAPVCSLGRSVEAQVAESSRCGARRAGDRLAAGARRRRTPYRSSSSAHLARCTRPRDGTRRACGGAFCGRCSNEVLQPGEVRLVHRRAAAARAPAPASPPAARPDSKKVSTPVRRFDQALHVGEEIGSPFTEKRNAGGGPLAPAVDRGLRRGKAIECRVQLHGREHPGVVLEPTRRLGGPRG